MFCDRFTIVDGVLQSELEGSYPAEGSVLASDLGYTYFRLIDVSDRSAIETLRTQ